jgi:hypothetical protein
MSKFQRGMQILKASFAVVRERPGLAGMSFAGAAVSGVIAAVLAALVMPGIPFEQLQGKLLFFLIIQVAFVPMTFTNFAIAAIADRHFRGERMSVGDAFALAMEKAPKLLLWSAMSAVVGLVLQAILERFKLGGVIASKLLGLAWALATTFVIPILVVENVSVTDAVGQSAKTFKEQWGPSVTADAGIGIAAFFAILVATFGFIILFVISPVVAFIIGGAFMVALMGAFGATTAVKNVALYRFASDGTVVGDYTVEQLNGAYRPKKSRRFLS